MRIISMEEFIEKVAMKGMYVSMYACMHVLRFAIVVLLFYSLHYVFLLLQYTRFSENPRSTTHFKCEGLHRTTVVLGKQQLDLQISRAGLLHAEMGSL